MHKGPNGDCRLEADHSPVRLPTAEGVILIRQVITCNICGSQKRQTNHWFVAYQETGELRISGWNSLRLLSPGTKHLCGEALCAQADQPIPDEICRSRNTTGYRQE